MKLIITADLHFGSREAGNASVREIASEIAQSDADALVLAGDGEIDGIRLLSPVAVVKQL